MPTRVLFYDGISGSVFIFGVGDVTLSTRVKTDPGIPVGGGGAEGGGGFKIFGVGDVTLPTRVITDPGIPVGVGGGEGGGGLKIFGVGNVTSDFLGF